MTDELKPKPAFMKMARGKQREGDSVAYGTTAPLVREALQREGVITVTKWARAHGLSVKSVEAALEKEETTGGAVHLFAAYWHPALAAVMKAEIEDWRTKHNGE